MGAVTLRPYQQAAMEAVLREWDEGHDRTLLVLPTGCGKTIVFAKIAESRVRVGERVLIMAHRGELLEQAGDKILQATGLKCAVEKAEQTCRGSWYRIVVGSVQTLMRDKRLKQFPADFFDTIIIDEAHHSVSDSYQHVLQYFERAKVLGVTATPDRADMRNTMKAWPMSTACRRPSKTAICVRLWLKPSLLRLTFLALVCLPAITRPGNWGLLWTRTCRRLPKRC